MFWPLPIVSAGGDDGDMALFLAFTMPVYVKRGTNIEGRLTFLPVKTTTEGSFKTFKSETNHKQRDRQKESCCLLTVIRTLIRVSGEDALDE